MATVNQAPRVFYLQPGTIWIDTGDFGTEGVDTLGSSMHSVVPGALFERSNGFIGPIETQQEIAGLHKERQFVLDRWLTFEMGENMLVDGKGLFGMPLFFEFPRSRF